MITVCMYTRINNDKSDMLIIVMYVDDLLIAASSVSNIEKLKRELSEKFKMSDCGPLKHFVGMKIEVSYGILSISQESSIQKYSVKVWLIGLQCNKNTNGKRTSTSYEYQR